jgi:serine/threonine protein kinase/tetratricopeptide (TPR) repeat protein
MGADKFETLPPAVKRRIDECCGEFEQALRQGQHPRIEAYLPRLDDSVRTVLLRELLHLEWEHRRQAGDTPASSEFCARFPEAATWIEEVCGPISSADLSTTSTAATVRRELLLAPAPAAELRRGERIGRYVVEEELGRGGMGAVYRVRDENLPRALAVKVLLDVHGDDPGLRGRFLEEAQIMGQLQHPGVAPVHEVGALSDGRPFFSMKQIKGQTLATLLKAPQDLPRFLSIFEQVCQTIAFAHSRGIIHRDLKPANVMVGAFGEVQVMDWGLAKLIAPLAAASTVEHAGAPAGSTFYNPRSAADGIAATVAGSVLGTITYMPPEQARGEIHSLDERCDVFSLGAILCEILTGKPPFAAESQAASFRLARDGNLSPAFERLAACGADPEIMRLAKDCLAARKEDRLREAGVVAARMADHQARVQQRLRQAEIDRATAQARAEEERKRRRVQRTLAGVVMLLLAGVAGAGLWYQREADRQAAEEQNRQTLRAERQRFVQQEIDGALAGVDRQRAELLAQLTDSQRVHALLSDPARWAAMLRAAQLELQRARTLADGDWDLLDEMHRERLQQLERAVREDEQGLELAQKLDGIRLYGHLFTGDTLNHRATADQVRQRYQLAFLEAGFDLDSGDLAAMATRIRNSTLRYVLVAGLDHWAYLGERGGKYFRLLTLAKLADPDPWRDQVRAVNFFGVTPFDDLKKLTKLAQEADLAKQSPQIVLTLAMRIKQIGGDERPLLRKALVHHARDFWLHFTMGNAVEDMGERIGCYQAALAVRPQTTAVHINLGLALAEKHERQAAITHFLKCIELDPQQALGYKCLADELVDLEDLPGAIAQYQKALELEPGYLQAHINFTKALFMRADWKTAHAYLQKAVTTYPKSAWTYDHLGVAQRRQQDLPGAVQSFRRALELDPKSASAHNNLGDVLTELNNLPEAIRHLRRATEIAPKLATAHYNLGRTLYQAHDPAGAVAAYQAALALEPDKAETHCNLGLALLHLGRFSEALQALKEGDQRGRRQPGWKYPSQDWVAESERCLALDQRLTAVVSNQAQPSGADERLALAEFCRRYKQQPCAAVRFFSDAFAAAPQLAEDARAHHRFLAACAAAQAAAGKGKDAGQLAEPEKAKLRRQALEWLRAELSATSRQAQSEPGHTKRVAQFLKTWFMEPNLASVREDDELLKLPTEERALWRQLWTEAQDLQSRLAAG